MNLKPPPYISNSQLNAFKRSPAHWLHYITEKRAQTPAMLLGSVCHLLALQPESFEKKYFIIDPNKRPKPDMNFNGKENKEWWAKMEEEAAAKSLTVVDKDILDTAKNCVESLQVPRRGERGCNRMG